MTKAKGTPGPVTLTLAPRLDYAACAQLHSDIGAARGRALVLDAGKVTFLGGLALDIVMRARAEWRAQGLDFAITAPSDDLFEGLTVLGVPPDTLIPGLTDGVSAA